MKRLLLLILLLLPSVAHAATATDWSAAFTAWWKLDEATGASRASSGSCTTDCALSDVGTTDVEQDTTNKQEGTGSASWNADTDRLESAHRTEWAPSSALTFGGWVRVTDETADRMVQSHRQFSTSGWEIRYESSTDKLTCGAMGSANDTGITDTTPDDTWQFAVCTL